MSSPVNSFDTLIFNHQNMDLFDINFFKKCLGKKTKIFRTNPKNKIKDLQSNYEKIEKITKIQRWKRIETQHWSNWNHKFLQHPHKQKQIWENRKIRRENCTVEERERVFFYLCYCCLKKGVPVFEAKLRTKPYTGRMHTEGGREIRERKGLQWHINGERERERERERFNTTRHWVEKLTLLYGI